MYSNLLKDPNIIYIYIYIYITFYVAFNFFSPPKRKPTSRQSGSYIATSLQWTCSLHYAF